MNKKNSNNETKLNKLNRKPLPKTRTLSNTGNLKAQQGGADVGGGVVTHGCSGGCGPSSYCTLTC